MRAAKEGPGNPANVPLFEKRISGLKAEKERYQTMNPDTYILPEKKLVSVKMNQPSREGSMLELPHLSKSGPFYHIAGIQGDDYKAIRSVKEYRMTIYLVYSRDYPFESHYALCICEQFLGTKLFLRI